jgi:hypothetical protein
MFRPPSKGWAPMISDRKTSEAASPCSTQFSPPSSMFSTNCSATRAPPGQRACGGSPA